MRGVVAQKKLSNCPTVQKTIPKRLADSLFMHTFAKRFFCKTRMNTTVLRNILNVSILGGGVAFLLLTASCGGGEDDEPLDPPAPSRIEDYTDGGHFRYDNETGQWVEACTPPPPQPVSEP